MDDQVPTNTQKQWRVSVIDALLQLGRDGSRDSPIASADSAIQLRRAGYRARSQDHPPGIGTVDLLVDDWLIIELDSRNDHGGADNQLRDRVRDGNAVIGSYGHERFLWEQVRESMG
ncbi:MAG: hypothetical protein ABI053_01105 [Lacisediminihabitans sp.]